MPSRIPLDSSNSLSLISKNSLQYSSNFLFTSGSSFLPHGPSLLHCSLYSRIFTIDSSIFSLSNSFTKFITSSFFALLKFSTSDRSLFIPFFDSLNFLFKSWKSASGTGEKDFHLSWRVLRKLTISLTVIVSSVFPDGKEITCSISN